MAKLLLLLLYTSNIHNTDLETFQNFQSARDIHRLHKNVRVEQVNKFQFKHNININKHQQQQQQHQTH